jgi:hypothetical protein
MAKPWQNSPQVPDVVTRLSTRWRVVPRNRAIDQPPRESLLRAPHPDHWMVQTDKPGPDIVGKSTKMGHVSPYALGSLQARERWFLLAEYAALSHFTFELSVHLLHAVRAECSKAGRDGRAED